MSTYSEAMRLWSHDISRAIRAHADHIDSASNHDADEFDLDPEYAGAKRYMDRMNELFGESLAKPNATHDADEAYSTEIDGMPWETSLPPASPWKEADARCARCSEGENIGEVVAEMDEALIAYANRELSRDPVWSQLYAVRQAMVSAL